MIYFIGGSPRCGKTTLAKTLSERLNVSWIPTDTIESMTRAYTPNKESKKNFPKSVIRQKTRYSNDIMYTKYTSKQIARAYIQQSKAIWKAIEKLVESELKEGRSYIIEGYHIHPSLITMLKKKYGARNIRAAFLIKVDASQIVKLSERYTSKTDWFVKRTKSKDTYPKIAEMILELSNFYLKEAKKNTAKVFVMDNKFNTRLSAARRFLAH